MEVEAVVVALDGDQRAVLVQSGSLLGEGVGDGLVGGAVDDQHRALIGPDGGLHLDALGHAHVVAAQGQPIAQGDLVGNFVWIEGDAQQIAAPGRRRDDPGRGEGNQPRHGVLPLRRRQHDGQAALGVAREEDPGNEVQPPHPVDDLHQLVHPDPNVVVAEAAAAAAMAVELHPEHGTACRPGGLRRAEDVGLLHMTREAVAEDQQGRLLRLAVRKLQLRVQSDSVNVKKHGRSLLFYSDFIAA